jgi:NAD(P)-dependent dehydrogenase (short-subunit alcohol dehydrogenase family)
MGGNVVIMDIQDQPVGEYIWLPKKFGIKTYYIKTDVTKEAELNASFSKAIDFLGTLDGLVPCAGIAIDKPFTEQTWAEMTRIQELNVISNVFVIPLGTGKFEMPFANVSRPSGPRRFLFRAAGSQADAEARERRKHGLDSLPVCSCRHSRIPHGGLQRLEGRR